MNCLEVQDQLSGHVAQALGESVREAVRDHLAGCAACTDAQGRLRKAWDFLEGMEVPPVPLDLSERVRAARGGLAPGSEPPPLPPPPKSLALRAGLLILLAAGGGGAAAWKAGLFRPAPLLPEGVHAPPPVPPPVPWEAGEGVLRLLGVPQAAVWASPGGRGDLSSRGVLRIESGMVWGRVYPDETLRLEVAGWRATAIRGTFTVTAGGGMATLTCHEGFVRIEPAGADPVAVPEGRAVLLMEGKSVGPLPARSIYPGDRQ